MRREELAEEENVVEAAARAGRVQPFHGDAFLRRGKSRKLARSRVSSVIV